MVRAYPHVGTVYRITGREGDSKEGPFSPPNRRIRYPPFLFLLFPVLGVTPLRPTFTLIQSAKKRERRRGGGKKGGGGNQIGNLSPRRRRGGKKKKLFFGGFFSFFLPPPSSSHVCHAAEEEGLDVAGGKGKKLLQSQPGFFLAAGVGGNATRRARRDFPEQKT